MSKKHQETISLQSSEQAMTMAKGTQKPGQSKEQTKLIAAGIEKGIAQYKKQHKAKMREQDKARKKQVKVTNIINDDVVSPDVSEKKSGPLLPWILLALSWTSFIVYVALMSTS